MLVGGCLGWWLVGLVGGCLGWWLVGLVGGCLGWLGWWVVRYCWFLLEVEISKLSDFLLSTKLIIRNFYNA